MLTEVRPQIDVCRSPDGHGVVTFMRDWTRHREGMRVAVVTESFLPSVNGVAGSVCRVLDHLRRRGHEAMVICPAPAPATYNGYPVHGVAGFSYHQFAVGVPTPDLRPRLQAFAPDVVHAASPFVLGAAGVFAAARLGIPSVAVYQTDVAGFARTHGMRLAHRAAWGWIRRVHTAADLTLAPSGPTIEDLVSHGVPRVHRWARGVDTTLFDPAWRTDRGSRALRHALAPQGQVLVGYVGRLSPEKRVERLTHLAGIAGSRLVVVGDGPSAGSVARALAGTDAVLLGRREGEDLARAYACLDLFVHTGTDETFGQTVQEAMACALPVVAPASGGPLDLVEPGVTGLLHPADGSGLRDAVERLVADADLRARLGAAGRLRVQARSWEAVGDELLAHYASVIDARGTAAA